MTTEALYTAQCNLLKPLYPHSFDGDEFMGDDNDMAVLIAKVASELRDNGLPIRKCYEVEQLAGANFFHATWEQYEKLYS